MAPENLSISDETKQESIFIECHLCTKHCSKWLECSNSHHLEVGTLIAFFLEIRKPRHKEVEQHTSSTLILGTPHTYISPHVCTHTHSSHTYPIISHTSHTPYATYTHCTHKHGAYLHIPCIMHRIHYVYKYSMNIPHDTHTHCHKCIYHTNPPHIMYTCTRCTPIPQTTYPPPACHVP